MPNKISIRIRRKGPGWVFTPSDFRDIGNPQAVGMTLLRMVRKGTIKRLNRGMYYTPRLHELLGELYPDVKSIIEAVSRRDGDEIHEFSEAQAANMLGLSDQVPARLVYLTTGRTRSYMVGKLKIELRHRSPRKLRGLSPVSIIVFAAFRNIGKVHLTIERIARLHRHLPDKDRKLLARDLPKAPDWMHPFLRHLSQ